MYLTEQHIITVNDKRYKDLDRICFLSKNLYRGEYIYFWKGKFETVNEPYKKEKQ